MSAPGTPFVFHIGSRFLKSPPEITFRFSGTLEQQQEACRRGVGLYMQPSLILAAEQLLEACKAALPHHDGGHSNVGRLLRAAIERAEAAR